MRSSEAAVAYIIPGFRQTTRTRTYRRIMDTFERAGIRPVGINIHWQRSVMTQYVKEFMSQTQQYHSQPCYLLGFSFGAMVGLIAAAQGLKVRRMFLCSLSPYFSELLTQDRDVLERSLGKRRLEDFRGIHFRNVAHRVHAATDILVGERELRSVIKVARLTRRAIASARLLVIKGASHSLDQANYLSTVIRRIKTISKNG
jgi:hypothetical protein